MRFDENDERDAYRRGARDCFECFAKTFSQREARAIASWLEELEKWEFGEPPPPPLL